MSVFTTKEPDVRTFVARRRARLIDRLHARGLDGALITDPRDIMYFTGAMPAAPAPACLFMGPNGHTILVCGDGDAAHHVDELHSYAWHSGGTISAEMMPLLVTKAHNVINVESNRLGIQRDSAAAVLLATLQPASWMPVDAEIIDLERTKDALDLAGMVGAIRANLAAYHAVSAAIAPGVSELEVFASGWRGATMHCGHKVLHDGDYSCGAINGPARDRPIERGELYIVDAWTMRAGYWSDLSRVFPVGDHPSSLQQELITHATQVHERMLPLLRPGARCAEIWSRMDAILREHPALRDSGLTHHGGHGVGIRIHEPPDINPEVSDTLRAGDVISLEPGAYTPAARAGARIENTYLITERGAERLSNDPE